MGGAERSIGVEEGVVDSVEALVARIVKFQNLWVGTCDDFDASIGSAGDND